MKPVQITPAPTSSSKDVHGRLFLRLKSSEIKGFQRFWEPMSFLEVQTASSLATATAYSFEYAPAAR